MSSVREEVDLSRRLDKLFADTFRQRRPVSRRGHGKRSWFTRGLDSFLITARLHCPTFHKIGVWLFAFVVFLYASLVVRSARMVQAPGPGGSLDLEEEAILAAWHGSAPSLLLALAKQRPQRPVVVMVAEDPRGDFLAVLCHLLGFDVVRGDAEHRPKQALVELALAVRRGACPLITADGFGPARMARPGAVLLSALAGVPLTAIGSDCSPALTQHRKWDQARNPLPFCRLAVHVGQQRAFPALSGPEALEEGRNWLQRALDAASSIASRELGNRPKRPNP